MVFKTWIKGLRIPLLMLVGLFLATPAFSSPCSAALFKISKERLKEEFTENLIDKMAKAAISQLSREAALPGITDLTDALTPKEFKAPPKTREREFILDVLAYAQKKFADEYQRTRKPLLKEAIGFMETEFRTPNSKEMAEGLNLSDSEFRLIYGSTDNLFEEIKEAFPKSIERLQNTLAFAYANLAMKTGRTPSPEELAAAVQISEKQLERIFEDGAIFKSFAVIKERANALRPKSFHRTIDTDVFNDARVAKMETAVLKRKVIIYTDAVAGAPVNEVFLQAMLKYCEENDGEIVVRPQNMITYGLDPILLSTDRVHVAFHTWELGKSLALQNTKLTAKQIKSLTGLERIGPRGQVQIFATPKMDVNTVATVKNATSPHMLMTTGALTDPYYNGALYIQGRTDVIAAQDHVMGALIIEKDFEPNGKVGEQTRNDFHLRHIEFIPEKAGFMDKNKFYTAKKVSPAKIIALNLGDTHPGDTDPIAFASLPELFKLLKPEIVTVEDAFNGHSLSHHNENQAVTKSQLAKQGKLDVTAELALATNQLNEILKMDPDVKVIVKVANHNNWVKQWVQSGAYHEDNVNRVVGHELFLASVRGEDPLEVGMRKAGIIDGNRVEFLKPGQQLPVGPKNRRVYLHLHGHAGENGKKGLSLEGLRRAAGRGVIAHTHTYKRLGGAVNIGTLTKLILSYNEDGISNWVQSISYVGENGEVQALQFKNGRWFAPVGVPVPDAKRFFEPGYPNVVPNNLPSDGTGQLDQHNRLAGRR